MNTALCTIDAVPYHSLAFAAMGEDRIEALRYSLECTECRGRAYFKKAGVDGRAPCFGARHGQGCTQATGGGMGWGDGGEGDQPEVPNPGTPIRIDLAVGARADGEVAGAGAGQRAQGRGRRFAGGQGARAAQPRWRLRSILKALIETDLGQSDHVFQAPNGRPLAARTYFVPAEFAGAMRHRNEPRGIWGTVLSVKHRGGDAYWLNTGDPTQLSFRVEEHVMAAILERFHRADPEDLTGADILVLTRPNVAASGKLYARVPGADYTTLRFTDA